MFIPFENYYSFLLNLYYIEFAIIIFNYDLSFCFDFYLYISLVFNCVKKRDFSSKKNTGHIQKEKYSKIHKMNFSFKYENLELLESATPIESIYHSRP